MATSKQAKPARRGRRWAVILLVGAALGLTFRGTVDAHARATSLLLRFADPNASGFLAEYGQHAVDEAPATVATPHGEVPARLYTPRGADGAPGIVVLHGVHRLGIEEPRLIRFARAIAASGVVALTPEIAELADYHVDPRSIETIGSAARTLRERTGRRAGIMGMCFAGSLSLLSAADPRYADAIGFVLSVGAHHDLARVSRFFAENSIERVDGSTERLKAHDYGALVLVYAHIERFFPEPDVPAARNALRLWLWEQPDEARTRAADLSPAGRERLLSLFERRLDAIAPELLAEIAASREAMGTVSPHGHLAAVRAPIFLLHGSGDTVIPPTELEWLAGEIPEDRLRGALISPAILHVELQGEPGLGERWALVHFMAGVLAEASAAEP